LIDCFEAVKKAKDTGLPILYLDVAVFTFNTIRKRAWYCKFENLRVRQDMRQIKTQALIAAVENDRGLVAHAIYSDSVDTDKFVAFIKDLRSRMP